MHPRNKHIGTYKFEDLILANKELSSFVCVKYGRKTIDFSNPKGVKALNKALLNHFYQIKYWNIPNDYLCPPVPGRADYIHYVADFLGCDLKKTANCSEMTILDIGVGANCIYPLIGHKEYGWNFIGTEVDYDAFKSARSIVADNELGDFIGFRFQKGNNTIFRGIIEEDDFFEMAICNPPFHSSEEEAQKSTKRKWKNLGIKKGATDRNFGGKTKELWYPGGEKAFIKKMIYESQNYGKNCRWFSTLVSKKTNLPSIYQYLKTVSCTDLKTVEMNQGQKQSRIVFWSFY